VAQIGAALGRSFSHEPIGAAAAMPQQQIDDALAQLVTAELSAGCCPMRSTASSTRWCRMQQLELPRGGGPDHRYD
jgi:hypothetical protein